MPHHCTGLQTHLDGFHCHFKVCLLLSDFLFLVNILLYFFRWLYPTHRESPSLFLTIAYNPPKQRVEVLTDGL